MPSTASGGQAEKMLEARSCMLSFNQLGGGPRTIRHPRGSLIAESLWEVALETGDIEEERTSQGAFRVFRTSRV